jgi:soluble lytic murein transglycosylase-like protein
VKTLYQRKAAAVRLAMRIAGFAALAILMCMAFAQSAHAQDPSLPYRSMLVREAQAVYGPDAPAPMFAGQIRQESSWRPGVTAWDNGRGMAQFMDGTTKQVSDLFPELGPAAPYDPRWAIRAMVRYDGWIYKRLQGKDPCHRWGAAMKGYNAGPGYVQQAQAKSKYPGIWFGVTEFVPTRQSATNFEYSRTYPHKILFKHQPLYAGLGHVICPFGVPNVN